MFIFPSFFFCNYSNIFFHLRGAWFVVLSFEQDTLMYFLIHTNIFIHFFYYLSFALQFKFLYLVLLFGSFYLFFLSLGLPSIYSHFFSFENPNFRHFVFLLSSNNLCLPLLFEFFEFSFSVIFVFSPFFIYIYYIINSFNFRPFISSLTFLHCFISTFIHFSFLFVPF